MSNRRKDSRGRVLRTGEFQRSKDRYEYKYVSQGKRKTVYSSRLLETDPIPPGCKEDLSLREKEKQIQKDIDDHIAIH